MDIPDQQAAKDDTNLVQQCEHLISREGIYVIGGVLHVDKQVYPALMQLHWKPPRPAKPSLSKHLIAANANRERFEGRAVRIAFVTSVRHA
jgi:hypothetical protein